LVLFIKLETPKKKKKEEGEEGGGKIKQAVETLSE
jgi:hypothetical protein